MKKKLFALFLAVQLVFLGALAAYRNAERGYLLERYHQALSHDYHQSLFFSEQTAQLIHRQLLDRPEVLRLFAQATDPDDPQPHEARQRLLEQLRHAYRSLYRSGVRQLHFHLANGDSFLRFHRPEKYGDNLFAVRESVRLANTSQAYISGFEEGRIFNGFRHVFPLFYENRHLGSVEVSFGFDFIRQSLNARSVKYYKFLLRHDTMDAKVFEDEQYNYRTFPHLPGLVEERPRIQPLVDPHSLSLRELSRLFAQVKEPLSQAVEKGRSFVGEARRGWDGYILALLPVHNFLNQPVAYVISLSRDDQLVRLDISLALVWLAILGLSGLALAGGGKALAHREAQLTLAFEHQATLGIILESGQIGIWDWNPKTGAVQYDRGWAQMLGYRLEELEPTFQTWQDRVHRDDRVACQEAIDRHLRGDAPVYRCTHRLKHKDGHWVYVLASGRIIERNALGEPTRILGTQVDISAERRLQEQLRESNQTKDRFFSLVAHDLKSPFSGLLGLSEVAVDMAQDTKDEELISVVGSVNQAATQAYALLEDLLNWARLQSGRVEPQWEPLDLSEQVALALAPFTPRFEAKQLNLHLDLQGAQGIRADRRLFAEVMENLLSNAQKFTPRGGQIELRSWREGEAFKLSITNSGNGIDPKNEAKLFDYAQIFSTSGTEGELGTGLGLTLCAEYLALLGGEIQWNSGYEGGTQFILTLNQDQLLA